MAVTGQSYAPPSRTYAPTPLSPPQRIHRTWRPPGSGSPTDTPTSGMSGEQRNAYNAVLDMLTEFGLQSLAPKILGYIKDGYDAASIGYEIQQTAEWKQRFVANETRKKNGLSVLSPQEYIATERAYRQIMHQAGVPVGFYDSQADFTNFIAGDIAPQEIQQRVQAAADFVNRADPRELAAMRQFYTTGDLIAFALDQNRAAPLVERAFQASAIAGQAGAQGLNVDKQLADRLAANGITREQAQQGFSLISSEQANANKLAAISGEGGFTTADLAAETFLADAGVGDKRKKLASQERGRFGGSSGVGAGSLTKGGSGSL